MNYEPSHRRPPHQERWPNATPGEAWPAYQRSQAAQAPWPAEAMAGRSSQGYAPTPRARVPRPDSAPRDGAPWDGAPRDGAPREGAPRDGAPWDSAPWDSAPWDSGPCDGASRDSAGWDDTTWNGSTWDEAGWNRPAAGPADGYAGAADDYGDWDGYQAGQEFAGAAGHAELDDRPAYRSGASSGLVAPDMAGEWWRQPDEDAGAGRATSRDSVVIGAVMGFLSAAVAFGVATLAAGLLRPQASPVHVIGEALLDRLPAGARATAATHLGAHSGPVLLLGLAAVVAVVTGVVARRNPGRWVLGLAAFGLLGSFVAVTRPGGRTIDVLPPAVGAAAGILALLWLARTAAPLTTVPVTPARAASRRSGSSSRRRPR